MPPFDKTHPQSKPFKLRKSFATRKQEVAGIRSKFPNKIPVIIERYEREKFLPPLDKTKFLVPHELTMTQFVTIIRFVIFSIVNTHILGAAQSYDWNLQPAEVSSCCSASFLNTRRQ
ncbi:microtubule-associated proteins 1A/1B light chain 3C isoform X2 [Thunnus thynnus]|uniref:microtubule-associated proteins 1A/1B light chain 3C isoform X2 n=1 Tax=Thunnus thynnus TaxID=8237 RepID=UPI003528FD04